MLIAVFLNKKRKGFKYVDAMLLAILDLKEF